MLRRLLATAVVLGFVLIVALEARRVTGAVMIGILAVTAIGSLASFSWYDPVQILTGVAR